MLIYLLACATNAAQVAPIDPSEPSDPASEQAAFPDCVGSCALPGGHAEAEELSESAFLGWLTQWAEEPIGEPTLALETLLFHGHRSEELLKEHGDRLDVEHREYLVRELSRHTVHMSMRLIDEHGVVRGVLDSGGFPLKEKQHLVFADTGSLGWLETGGKIKRVGLGHLWSRW
jgi:hypothetical protein